MKGLALCGAAVVLCAAAATAFAIDDSDWPSYGTWGWTEGQWDWDNGLPEGGQAGRWLYLESSVEDGARRITRLDLGIMCAGAHRATRHSQPIVVSEAGEFAYSGPPRGISGDPIGGWHLELQGGWSGSGPYSGRQVVGSGTVQLSSGENCTDEFQFSAACRSSCASPPRSGTPECAASVRRVRAHLNTALRLTCQGYMRKLRELDGGATAGGYIQVTPTGRWRMTDFLRHPPTEGSLECRKADGQFQCEGDLAAGQQATLRFRAEPAPCDPRYAPLGPETFVHFEDGTDWGDEIRVSGCPPGESYIRRVRHRSRWSARDVRSFYPPAPRPETVSFVPGFTGRASLHWRGRFHGKDIWCPASNSRRVRRGRRARLRAGLHSVCNTPRPGTTVRLQIRLGGISNTVIRETSVVLKR